MAQTDFLVKPVNFLKIDLLELVQERFFLLRRVVFIVLEHMFLSLRLIVIF